jgi:hypothetical protein
MRGAIVVARTELVSISFRNRMAISSIIGIKPAGETLPELESRPPGVAGGLLRRIRRFQQ